MNHRPRKRFGQHFLRDAEVAARMVAAIGPRRGDLVVEIGGGDGALSRPLLSECGALTVVELDRDLVPRLEERCRGVGELTVRQADALKFDFRALGHGRKIRLAGNLPYNISTPLLFHIAAFADVIEDVHVLLQREVARRVAAAPGGGDYGRLSVMTQAVFAAEILFAVTPAAFDPPPKVHSAFVRLRPHAAPSVAIRNRRAFAAVVAAAFAHRRKTLKNGLGALVDGAGFAAAGVDPARRAETLSLAEFAALADVIKSPDRNPSETPPNK